MIPKILDFTLSEDCTFQDICFLKLSLDNLLTLIYFLMMMMMQMMMMTMMMI